MKKIVIFRAKKTDELYRAGDVVHVVPADAKDVAKIIERYTQGPRAVSVSSYGPYPINSRDVIVTAGSGAGKVFRVSTSDGPIEIGGGATVSLERKVRRGHDADGYMIDAARGLDKPIWPEPSTLRAILDNDFVFTGDKRKELVETLLDRTLAIQDRLDQLNDIKSIPPFVSEARLERSRSLCLARQSMLRYFRLKYMG
jgi:hypothetical protein